MDFKPDLIIGSSMGGFFAYNLSRELNISSILFNPALHSRSFTPDMKGFSNMGYKPNIKVVFGKNDNVIDPKITIKLMENEGYDNFILLGPYDVFKSEILNFEVNN